MPYPPTFTGSQKTKQIIAERTIIQANFLSLKKKRKIKRVSRWRYNHPSRPVWGIFM